MKKNQQMRIRKGWTKPYADIQHTFIRYYQYKLKSINAIRLYLELAAWAGQEREVFLSYNGIAAMLGASQMTAIRAVQELEEVGLIVKEQQFRENGSKMNNDYFLPELFVPEGEQTSLDRWKQWNEDKGKKEKHPSNTDVRTNECSSNTDDRTLLTPVSDLNKEILNKEKEEKEEVNIKGSDFEPIHVMYFKSAAERRGFPSPLIQEIAAQIQEVEYTPSALDEAFNLFIPRYTLPVGDRNRIANAGLWFKRTLNDLTYREQLKTTISVQPKPAEPFPFYNWLEGEE